MSPCTNLCEMDELSGLCKGCWRTIEEISEWRRMSHSRKLAVLKNIQRRKSQQKKQI
ncbi:MAG TPA: DUF1289 domain-containing protein [Caldithrix abyssi]|uniref:DUF1289 domain-containing protein n=1 Tax=Caldithrix abyssi TaxID=187145 RepID=A0A7V5RQI7_CALAY|nr:DUF1289 domain-containing protein [Caldithrix abyssi]